MSSNEWIAISWRNESHKERTLMPKEAKNAIRRVHVQVLFNEGNVMIGNEIYTE